MTQKTLQAFRLTTNISHSILTLCEVKNNRLEFTTEQNPNFVLSMLENLKQYCVAELDRCNASTYKPVISNQSLRSNVSYNELEELVYQINALVPSLMEYERFNNLHFYIESLENTLCSALLLMKMIHDRN